MGRHSLLRQSLTVLPVATLLLSLSGQAFANTELTPAARLVAPFFDISPGRDTFLILANVSRWVRLDMTTFPCGPGPTGSCGPFGVHLEFYGQSCARADLSTTLTPVDVDLIDLRQNTVVSGASLPGAPLGPVTPSAFQSGLGGRGWVDIDVRFGAGVGPTVSDPGVQANVLTGVVIIADSASDFAVDYPMAPSIGVSDRGLLGRVVRRDAAGRAIEWSGRYEPFPWRVFAPAFFAESGPVKLRLLQHTAFLALAGPADGNWDGSGNGEAPGQQLGAPGSLGEPLIIPQNLIFDGCEASIFTLPAPASSHYVNNFLSKVFPSIPGSSAWTSANCGVQFPVYPGLDEVSGQPVGWIDISNVALACDNTTPGAGAGNCPQYTTVSPATTFTRAGNGTGQRRGLVGVLIEHDFRRSFLWWSGASRGSARRLWGDPSPWRFGTGGGLLPLFPDRALCTLAIQTAGQCRYSFVDLVSHEDIVQQFGGPPGVQEAVPSPGEFP